MLNELEEFRAYTDPPVYVSAGKRDNTYLGRFTFDMLMQFEGLRRVMTILARGFMFDSGSPDFQRAREALLAWCSVPDKRKKTGEWQYRTAFPELHEVFPALVDEDGTGWFCRHVHNLCRFAGEHPESVSKKALENCQILSSGFDGAWRDKVVHMQVPLFTPTTLSAWGLRFDDVLADASELGPLRNRDFALPRETVRKLEERLPADLPFETAETLIKYYAAHRTEDSDWVVLPVVNFDAYFGSTVFGRKQLSLFPETILIRESRYGISRFKAAPDLIEDLPEVKTE